MSILPLLGVGMLCRISVAAPLSPPDAVSMALSLHPRLRTAEAALTEAEAAYARAAAPLYSPAFSARAAVGGERIGLSLAQPISLTGQRRLARQQASADLDAATAQRERARLTVAVSARSAYVEAVVTAAIARLARDSVALSEQLEHAARLRHEEGEASLLDLRLARLSLVRSASWLLEASAQESDALANLSAMIGQSVSAEDLTAAPLTAAPTPGAPPAAPRSDVLAAQARLQAAEQGLRLQRAAALAPLSVGVFASREDAEWFVGPSVGLELPLFSRNQLGQAEAAGALQAAEAAQTTVTARAITEVAAAAARHAEAEAQVTGLGADLSAEAEAALDGIALSYQSGHTDLLSTLLLQSEVMQGQAALITLQGQLADARLDLLLALEDEALLGADR